MGLNFRKVYEGKNPAAWVSGLAGKSGVYIIQARGGDILYIGESHTGRLKKTLLRHFQRWKGKTAGHTFDPDKIEVAVMRCPASSAVELQNNLIEEHRPEKNIVGKPPGFWAWLVS